MFIIAYTQTKNMGKNMGKNTYGVTTVGVGIEKDTQSLETIPVSKDRSHLGTLLGEPDGETVSNNTFTLAIHLELEVDLEVGSHQWLFVLYSDRRKRETRKR